MRLNVMIRRVERLQRGMDDIVRGACQGQASWIVKANRGQLKEGVNAEGELMNMGVYSKRHATARLKRGLKVDHVYLSFEGDLQNRMFVQFGQTGFKLESADWKQQLVDEAMRSGFWPSSGKSDPFYGPVFGLTEENKRELGKRIRPRVGRKVRKMVLG